MKAVQKKSRVFKDGKRRCPRCQDWKQLTEFSRNPTLPNGVNGYCKSCFREYERGPDRETEKQYQRQYYLKNKENLMTYRKAWREKNSHKIKAIKTVYVALRKGKLMAPFLCEQCGAIGRKLMAHHPSYKYPLRVHWVCRPCHMLIHRGLP